MPSFYTSLSKYSVSRYTESKIVMLQGMSRVLRGVF